MDALSLVTSDRLMRIPAQSPCATSRPRLAARSKGIQPGGRVLLLPMTNPASHPAFLASHLAASLSSTATGHAISSTSFDRLICSRVVPFSSRKAPQNTRSPSHAQARDFPSGSYGPTNRCLETEQGDGLRRLAASGKSPLVTVSRGAIRFVSVNRHGGTDRVRLSLTIKCVHTDVYGLSCRGVWIGMLGPVGRS